MGAVRCSRSQSAVRCSFHSPAAIASTARSASSTLGVFAHVDVLMSTNRRRATQAARLLPSGSGWFFASLTIRTAALSMNSG
jgi:hypothetical protein